MEQMMRKYPVGIQTFSEPRKRAIFAPLSHRTALWIAQDQRREPNY